MKIELMLAAILAFAIGFAATPAWSAESALEPMPAQLETRFALSALPPALRADAAVYLLDTKKGYRLSKPGTSGLVWHVSDGHLAFVDDQRGWKDTDIVFEIVRKGRRTELRFTHLGLEPGCECYDACAEGWDAVINRNLRQRIITGESQPNPFDEAA